MRIVQLSDLHLRDGPLYSAVDPWLAWNQALSRVAGLLPRPELLLLSGDLADDGLPDTYRRLAASLGESGIDFAVLPGNHDQRQALRAAFPDQPWGHPFLACQRVDRGDCSLLLLDTLIPGCEAGEFSAEQLAWLEENCPTGRRTIIVMHHPPFAVGIEGMDRIACADGERLAQWLAGRPQVEALLCGHVHRHVTSCFAGRLALTAPSTVHQIALQDGPLAWTCEPGAMLVHDWLPGQPLRTHYLPLLAAPVVVYAD